MMNHNSSHIKSIIQQIPEQPGIYQMLDSNHHIIYIGKSKCLKKRVQSYFNKSPKWEKVTRMVSFIHDIQYLVTDTHLEARLLECDLIKLHKPHFNAQMKNDQQYVYLKLTSFHRNNPLTILHEREDNCFGPFRSKYSLGELLKLLMTIYPLRRMKDGYDFDYHIFPLTMDEATLQANNDILHELLSSEDKLLLFIRALQDKMNEASSLFRFEIASMYRDMIKGFTHIKNSISRYQYLTNKKIVLKIPITNGHKLFYISHGQIVNSGIYSVLTDHNIEDFIKYSLSLDPTLPAAISDKAAIDYRDILYSEINSLPEDSIITLEV